MVSESWCVEEILQQEVSGKYNGVSKMVSSREEIEKIDRSDKSLPALMMSIELLNVPSLII